MFLKSSSREKISQASLCKDKSREFFEIISTLFTWSTYLLCINLREDGEHDKKNTDWGCNEASLPLNMNFHYFALQKLRVFVLLTTISLSFPLCIYSQLTIEAKNSLRMY